MYKLIFQHTNASKRMVKVRGERMEVMVVVADLQK
ncbi:hypothetical protein SLEP1_g48973 [Rubroshorea leprosula]|uniref:Uncharacterized protein n=1 Tax=Rubroshorea leprosula TaxID=152421 RepID=A0AAV5LV95_9ROSI|nr:hypothetical protein SLEP1_g48973 [Rubroshorea leprosula]